MPDVELELSYDSADAIPEGFAGLFDQTDEGTFKLAGVSGLKTDKDVAAVQEALRKEREDRKAAMSQAQAYSSLGSLEEIQAKLDKLPELEAAAEGKLDEDKIQQIVEGRLKQSTGPLQRQLETSMTENETLKAELQNVRNDLVSRDRNDIVRSVAAEMNVVPTALADVEMVAANFLERTEDGQFITKADVNGVTPGVDIKQFLKEMQKLRPHWWPPSQGGGSNGGGPLGQGEANPWSNEGWDMGKQGAVYKEDPSLAQRLAKAAGTSVGGLRPAPKQ